MEWACCQSSRPSGSPDPASKARRKCACFRRLLRWICWNCGSRGDLGRARNGWLIMRVHHGEAKSKSALLDRRDWLRLMLGGVIGSGGGTATARSAQSPAKETQRGLSAATKLEDWIDYAIRSDCAPFSLAQFDNLAQKTRFSRLVVQRSCMRSQFPAGGMGRGAGELWPRGRWGPTTLPGRPKSDGPFRLRDSEGRLNSVFLGLF